MDSWIHHQMVCDGITMEQKKWPWGVTSGNVGNDPKNLGTTRLDNTIRLSIRTSFWKKNEYFKPVRQVKETTISGAYCDCFFILWGKERWIHQVTAQHKKDAPPIFFVVLYKKFGVAKKNRVNDFCGKRRHTTRHSFVFPSRKRNNVNTDSRMP